MTAVLAGTSTTSILVGDTFTRGDATGIRFIANKIKNDAVNGFPIYPGAFSNTGLLYVPNRGILQAHPGDVIATDPVTGWPILISAASIAAGSSSWVIT